VVLATCKSCSWHGMQCARWERRPTCHQNMDPELVPQPQAPFWPS
jgi:hypothetical protein